MAKMAIPKDGKNRLVDCQYLYKMIVNVCYSEIYMAKLINWDNAAYLIIAAIISGILWYLQIIRLDIAILLTFMLFVSGRLSKIEQALNR